MRLEEIPERLEVFDDFSLDACVKIFDEARKVLKVKLHDFYAGQSQLFGLKLN